MHRQANAASDRSTLGISKDERDITEQEAAGSRCKQVSDEGATVALLRSLCEASHTLSLSSAMCVGDQATR